MLIRTERRVLELALVLCAMGTVNACATASRSASLTSADRRVSYPLMINNRTDFEVVVYAMASPTSRGQRLGTARAFGRTVLQIPEHALQSDNVFSVQLHAIGAPRTVPNWVSQGTVLNEDLMAQLEIVGDMAGNLRMSNLSARLAKTYNRGLAGIKAGADAGRRSNFDGRRPSGAQPAPAVSRFRSVLLAAAASAAGASLSAQVVPAPPGGFAVVRGVATDSIRQQPLARAIVAVEGTTRIAIADGAGNFLIDSIPAGSHRLSLSHAVLDTLGVLVMSPPMVMRPGDTITVEMATPSPARIVSMRCPAAILQLRGPGALMGQVYDPDSLKAAVGARVQLVYQETLLGFKGQPIVREASVDSTGTYRICGLPTPISGKLQVFRNGVSTGQVDVEVTGQLGLRSLTIAAAQVATVADTGGRTRRVLSGSSRLAGRILAKSGAPIQSARVSVEGALPVAITNEKGEFLLDSLPSGTQTVEVRKIGYAATDKPVELSARAIAQTTITLDVAELAPMIISAESNRVLEDIGFEDRKRRGLGTFIDGDKVNREAVRFSDALRTVPGIRVVPAGNGKSAFANSRDPVGGCVLTWVDNVRWRELSPGDLDDFVMPSEVRAIEVYSSNNTPAQFQMAGATSCATIVVWTNRYVNRRIKK